MIMTLAIENYRSLRRVALPMAALTLITGANGSGKSNLYRALRLLAETARGDVVAALAREGGLASTLWAGPEAPSARMRRGEVPVQGGPRRGPIRLRLGFADEDFGYAISLGLPKPDSTSAFGLDPEIKREVIWAGPWLRPASVLVDRDGPVVKVREGRGWQVHSEHLSAFESLFTQTADPKGSPETHLLRERIRAWRFYDQFRTDDEAPARQPRLGTRTPVMDHSGRDLAAALQTIREIGDAQGLADAIDDAFPGATLGIEVQQDHRFSLQLSQPGLLRPLSAAELSDGTLRYLLLVAGLLSPRPPPLMVLNEPETSLHPDLLPALARLIIKVSNRTQVWVVSHASRLIAALSEHSQALAMTLDKQLGQTFVAGQAALDEPAWHWPSRG
ncbi:MAG: AAA family ATPase [Gammaproteobacteria bacterium]|nr:AAA family ATPase [Gammaproteobacteria bacterium]